MKTKIISILTLIALSTSFVGCKKFLDVNNNPNIANNPNVELVLPSAQVAIASVMGAPFQINGSFWAQHWTQSPLASQYKNFDQYQVSSDEYNRPWRNLYAGALTDLKYVYNKAKAEDKKQYMAISRLMSAYTFQVLTDAFGDIPFSEALKGSVADGSIINPKYDNQEAVYDGIIAMIDEAQALIDVNAASHPGTDDLVFQGDMQKWLEFSNTLELKVYMRLSEANPTKAAAGVAALQGADFLSSSAKISYTTTGGSENPLYSEMIGLNGTTNIFASKTCVDFMNSYGDPRVGVFYKPLANGAVVGLTQGDFANSASATGKSLGGYSVGADPTDNNSATAPVYFISLPESEFLQAEAIARGWMTGDDAARYQSGILASLDAYQTEINNQIDNSIDLTAFGNANGTYSDYIDSMLLYIPYPSTEQDKIEAIINQKWVAMSGNQGFEAWTEMRRTGYPKGMATSVASVIGAGLFPARFLYPTDEINLNPKFPGTKLVTDKVWWDK